MPSPLHKFYDILFMSKLKNRVNNFMKASFDFMAILAVTWILISITITILLWSHLGARGWIWLGIHHTVCIIGCSHEYFRYQKRQVVRKEALSQ